jgi:hypothetical protein
MAKLGGERGGGAFPVIPVIPVISCTLSIYLLLEKILSSKKMTGSDWKYLEVVKPNWAFSRHMPIHQHRRYRGATTL